MPDEKKSLHGKASRRTVAGKLVYQIQLEVVFCNVSLDDQPDDRKPVMMIFDSGTGITTISQSLLDELQRGSKAERIQKVPVSVSSTTNSFMTNLHRVRMALNALENSPRSTEIGVHPDRMPNTDEEYEREIRQNLGRVHDDIGLLSLRDLIEFGDLILSRHDPMEPRDGRDVIWTVTARALAL